MKEVINMPKEARQIIVRALKLYQNSLVQSMEVMNQTPLTNSKGWSCVLDESLNYEHFDTIGLIGIFNEEDAELEVRIDSDARNTFVSKHDVDFPLWDGVPY
jgi:hypothetical protein